ncbi:MAG: Fic family protein [Poseidonibacter sp.]
MDKEFIPINLPIDFNLETTRILKKTISANRALAKLNGIAKIIPNSAILINSLVLQEAKDSSEIENIVTTHDELYKASIDSSSITKETKEVQNYREALLKGYSLVKENNLLLRRYIIEIQAELEQNDAGVRKQQGTNLKNQQTGEIVFTPPQDYEVIKGLLENLEKYINELLDIPILYLSRYIIKHKSDYYRLIQEVRTKDSFEEWILYMLEAVEKTSLQTIVLVNNIKNLMDKNKYEIREKLPKIYSKDLLEVIFMHPYTKIDFLVDILGLHRETASKHLKALEKIGIFESVKIGRSKFFIHKELYALLQSGI